MANIRPVGAVARAIVILGFLVATGAIGARSADAASYAAMVIDARSGEVLHSENADTRLHPASLTKMMTLYIAFEAVAKGEISLDTTVRISKHAASEPPSKLGLRAGQNIQFRHLIRASAVKSANDAATAIAEAIEGSESAFAARMNRTAKALGMTRTTFKNAHGLTQSGHLSTARDMTILGRHVFYDYNGYYHLFSRRTIQAGPIQVANTNRRLLGAYRGADGIKTGYTNAAGFNLVASAERGSERVIATVFGGRSSASRNAKVAELLDLGFARAPTHVAISKPGLPNYGAGRGVAAIVARSMRPTPRPGLAPSTVALADAVPAAEDVTRAIAAALPSGDSAPAPRPQGGVAELQVVSRMSTSGGRHWGINLGQYGSRYQAEQVLLKTALTEIGTLDEALRKVVRGPTGWEANFVGMSAETAQLACRRLEARDMDCSTLGPG